MSILQNNIDQVGQSGQYPKIYYFDTNDSLSTIISVGYLNSFQSLQSGNIAQVSYIENGIKLSNFFLVLNQLGVITLQPLSSQSSLSGINLILVSSTTSYTKPSNLEKLEIQIWGAGGAGGGTDTGDNQKSGSGGGGGAYCYALVNEFSIPNSVTITIGNKGVGVLAGNGNAGEPSSFGSLIQVNGGEGGLMGENTDGSLGGTGFCSFSPSDFFIILGGDGSNSLKYKDGTNTDDLYTGGAGGGSYLGFNSSQTLVRNADPVRIGEIGKGWGCGGSGSCGNGQTAGGNGQNGFCILKEYLR